MVQQVAFVVVGNGMLQDRGCNRDAARVRCMLLSCMPLPIPAVDSRVAAFSLTSTHAVAVVGAVAGARAGRSTGVGEVARGAAPSLAAGEELSLSHTDTDAPAVAAALTAAAHGDAATLSRFIGPGAMVALPIDLSVVLQLAGATGHVEAAEVALTSMAACGSADDGTEDGDRNDAENVAHARSSADVAADTVALPLAVAGGARSERLLAHLLDHWRADPSVDRHAAFWLAAEQRSVDAIDRLLQIPAWLDLSRSDKAIVRLDSSSGDLQLLERLLAEPRSRRCESTLGSESVGVIQRLLLDARADPAAAGLEALSAAAEQGHVSVLQALLADPRVDAAGFATRKLASPGRQDDAGAHVPVDEPDNNLNADATPLPAASVTLLARQPSVLRALALPVGDAAPLRPHTLTAVDATAMAAAAWKRRRAAVTAWWSVRN